MKPFRRWPTRKARSSSPTTRSLRASTSFRSTLGVDLVVHSATKYLNGHSDVTAGIVAGPRKLIEPVWEYARVHGPVLHPMEAWLLGRGLKTYALRMRQHNQSGALVAEALAKASGVAKVHYPGLASHPQHELARRQMPGGFGGMLSFEVVGSTARTTLQAGSDRVAECPAMHFGGQSRRHGDFDHSPRLDDLLPSVARSTRCRRRRAGATAAICGSRAPPGYRGRSHFRPFRSRRVKLSDVNCTRSASPSPDAPAAQAWNQKI